MTIESIAPIAFPLLVPQAVTQPGATGAVAGFGQMVAQGLSSVDHSLTVTQGQLQSLALGNPVSLHQVMIGMEESRLNFQLMMQVRNRLLEAYQDVMRMQV